MFFAQYTAQKKKFITKLFFGKLNQVSRSLQSPVITKSPVITNDYNNCFDIGRFWECFKTVEVIPTCTKGKPTEKTNYKPISILSIYLKFMKHLSIIIWVIILMMFYQNFSTASENFLVPKTVCFI